MNSLFLRRLSVLLMKFVPGTRIMPIDIFSNMLHHNGVDKTRKIKSKCKN